MRASRVRLPGGFEEKNVFSLIYLIVETSEIRRNSTGSESSRMDPLRDQNEGVFVPGDGGGEGRRLSVTTGSPEGWKVKAMMVGYIYKYKFNTKARTATLSDEETKQ